MSSVYVWEGLWVVSRIELWIWMFHLMLSFKSKSSSDDFKDKNECQLTSTFSSKMSLQCHMLSSTCHFNLESGNWRVIFSFTSHTTCQNLNYTCQKNVHFILVRVFACHVSKTCKKLCQKYTLTMRFQESSLSTSLNASRGVGRGHVSENFWDQGFPVGWSNQENTFRMSTYK